MKLYGLIGYPLGHSFSKKYFADKFKNQNISDCSYELYPIISIDFFPSLINDNPLFQGLNVTIPYKEQVLKYATEQTDAVKQIGAANTLKIIRDKIIAYNTDVIGFENCFKKKLKPYHKKALVLGNGGSSKAVQFVLQRLNIDYLLVTRNKELEPGTINYSMVDEAMLNDYKVIINCTPVGMYPNENECPQLPYQFLSKENYLFDLIYNPEKSLFLKQGEQQGAAIENGYDMLLIQAEESWKIWNED